MLPDIGGSELLVIAAVALIVVGPKDLPILMRKIGQFIGKMRGMANEFRASFDEMARQSELDELRKEVQAMRSGQYAQPFKDAADAARDVGLNETFGEISASLNGGVSAAPEITVAPPPAPTEVIEAPKPRAARAKAASKPKAEAVKAVASGAKTTKAPAKTTAKPAAKRASAKKTAELPAPTPRRAPVKKSDILS